MLFPDVARPCKDHGVVAANGPQAACETCAVQERTNCNCPLLHQAAHEKAMADFDRRYFERRSFSSKALRP